MPGWAKDSLDRWTVAGGFATGKIMRPVNKAGQLAGESMTPQSIFEVVERYSVRLGVRVAPHDLRRYAESRTMPNAPSGGTPAGRRE